MKGDVDVVRCIYQRTFTEPSIYLSNQRPLYNEFNHISKNNCYALKICNNPKKQLKGP